MAAVRVPPSRHPFIARVEAVAQGAPFYAVQVPTAVSAAFGKGRVDVKGTVNEVEIRTSLLPIKGGGHRMFLNRRIREAAGIRPGDRVKIVLARDTAPREEPMPEDLGRALRDADALGPFQRLARSTRNEVIRWVDDAKTEPTREKRIARAVERALAAREKEVDREVARARASRDDHG